MIHFGYPHNSEVKSAFCRPRHLDAPDSSVAQSVHDILPHGWADSVETESTKRFSAGKASFWRMIQKFHENSGILLRDSCDRHTEEPKKQLYRGCRGTRYVVPMKPQVTPLPTAVILSRKFTSWNKMLSTEITRISSNWMWGEIYRKPWCLPCLALHIMDISY